MLIRGERREPHDAEHLVAAELRLDAVRPELREELASPVTVGDLGVRGEVVRVERCRSRRRLLVGVSGGGETRCQQ